MNIDEEVISEIEKRRKLADRYYDNFRKYYENKNYSKASEFLWGSLNALAYAIGLLHGEKEGDHGKEECLASAQIIIFMESLNRGRYIVMWHINKRLLS